MKVRDMLAAKGDAVATVRPDATIDTVLHRLKLEGVGALVVSQDGDRIDGILSERDVVRIQFELSREREGSLGHADRVAVLREHEGLLDLRLIVVARLQIVIAASRL